MDNMWNNVEELEWTTGGTFGGPSGQRLWGSSPIGISKGMK